MAFARLLAREIEFHRHLERSKMELQQRADFSLLLTFNSIDVEG